jgi:hypothetical protein
MPAWWVNHGSTYAQERKGSYVWAPTKTKAEHPFDIRQMRAASARGRNRSLRRRFYSGRRNFAREADAEAPSEELPTESWADEGHLARVEYHDLKAPILLSDVPGPHSGRRSVQRR